MQLVNQHEIYETWAPIIESKTGLTERGEVEWLSTYCHFHSLNESAGAYNSLGVLNGMGQVQPASNYGLSYVKLDGNVGCMVNGAGLAMGTMDTINHVGGFPANFLDVGGGANAQTVAKGFEIILKDPNIVTGKQIGRAHV